MATCWPGTACRRQAAAAPGLQRERRPARRRGEPATSALAARQARDSDEQPSIGAITIDGVPAATAGARVISQWRGGDVGQRRPHPTSDGSAARIATTAQAWRLRGDVLGEARQRPEDAHVVLVVGAQLEAVALRDDQRDLEDVDRVEAEAFAVERRLRDRSRRRRSRGSAPRRGGRRPRAAGSVMGGKCIRRRRWKGGETPVESIKARLAGSSFDPRAGGLDDASRTWRARPSRTPRTGRASIGIGSANRLARRAFSSADVERIDERLVQPRGRRRPAAGPGRRCRTRCRCRSGRGRATVPALGDRRHLGHRARARARSSPRAPSACRP